MNPITKWLVAIAMALGVMILFGGIMALIFLQPILFAILVLGLLTAGLAKSFHDEWLA
jgi:hypothetical protein